MLRLTVVALTFALVALLCPRRWPAAARSVVRVVTVRLATTAVFFVIRTGHLGAKVAWGDEARAGGPLPRVQGSS